MDWQTFAEQIYFDPSQPGAFAGPAKLRQVLKMNDFNVALGDIKKWLQNQDSYSLLRSVRYRFSRQRIVTVGIDDLWDADLADVANISQHNTDFKYWLVVIDVFSRHLWVVPIKSKHHTHMTLGFRTLFEQTERRPKHLRTDKGTEFTNRSVKKLLKDENIHAYTTKNETKANYAERVIRTLKGLMYRYFLHKQTYTYTDVLQQLVDNYNQRPHRGIGGLSPSQVTRQNEAKLWKMMYVDTAKLKRKRSFAFEVDDHVRISHLKYPFQRDYQQKWTEEIFQITQRVRKYGHNLYMLQDLMNEPVDGHFYEIELQRITKDPNNSSFRVEKVIRRRRYRGQEELFVKWMGWPAKFNSWVRAVDIQRF